MFSLPTSPPRPPGRPFSDAWGFSVTTILPTVDSSLASQSAAPGYLTVDVIRTAGTLRIVDSTGASRTDTPRMVLDRRLVQGPFATLPVSEFDILDIRIDAMSAFDDAVLGWREGVHDWEVPIVPVTADWLTVFDVPFNRHREWQYLMARKVAPLIVPI